MTERKPTQKYLSEPLVTHIYTADPSAHVFNGRLYIYPSHDIECGVPMRDDGDHFRMEDYHVFSMASPGAEVVDHGVALHVDDVPWAARQMWAPDAACKNGKYYFYFPAKDAQGVFYIGAAVSDSPAGPFTPEPTAIAGSFSIDPAVYDNGDAHYMFFGGIWGGQLQRWSKGHYSAQDDYPADDEPALTPKMAKLADNMVEFAETPRDVIILDEDSKPLLAGDNHRRYFEGPWVHKYQGLYYLSYSTGDTHKIVYATSDNLYGPYTYRGVVLEPVLGWTNHHSITEFDGKWYLFYHDSSLSGGQTHLRCMKMTELVHNPDGSIETINAFVE